MLLFYLVLQSNTHKKYDASLISPLCVPDESMRDATLEEQYEIFAEHRSRFRYHFEPKKSKSSSSVTGGVRLLSFSHGVTQSLISPHLDFPELVSWLEIVKKSRSSHEIDTQQLDRLFHHFMIQMPGIKNLQAKLEGNFKNFYFLSHSKPGSEGFENYFSLIVDLTLKKDQSIRHLAKSFTRQDFALLMSDVSKTLINQDEIDKLFLTPWPAPRGKLPILWSEKIMADWVFLLIQMLQYQSELTEGLDNLKNKFPSLSFHLIDNWKPRLGCDALGTPRTELLYPGPQGPFRPVSPHQGFWRRASFEYPAILAPWQPALYGLTQTKNLLSEMKKGLSIHGCDLLSFDRSTGEIDLKVTKAYLVHDGKEGDPIEPTRWRLSLFDLLSSLELFSDQLRSHPGRWEQAGQTLFIEINTPQGLSNPLEFPGSVPLAHYW